MYFLRKILYNGLNKKNEIKKGEHYGREKVFKVVQHGWLRIG